MQIVRCRVNQIQNPMGYHMAGDPVFSYVVEGAEGSCQTEARIRVSHNPDMTCPMLDTGFSSEISGIAFSAPLSLQPRTRYYWDVAVHTDAGEEGLSERNWFETGKMGEKWEAQWIGCTPNEGRIPIFHSHICLSGPVRSARLYITSLGLYQASINGKKVGQERLTPYCNAYDRWLQAQTYDVTEMLSDHAELAVMVGNGWYSGRFAFDTHPDDKPFYGEGWSLLAELRIQYADGSEQVIGTDESWEVTRSQIVKTSIYDGEIVDGTLPETPASRAVFVSAPKAPVTDRLSTPVTAHQRLTPVELITTPKGEKVFDLGQNMTGQFRLSVHVPKGQKVHVQVGEILQNECFYRDNLRSAIAEYVYISDGEAHVLEPVFTFYGFRYAKVEGVENLKISDFEGLVLYSELPRTGELKTGNELVNRLILNAEWGQIGNFLDVPTDCPQRDERMGWTGDAQVFSATACFQRDCYAFYRKYLYDMAKEQEGRGGKVPDVIPAFRCNGTATVWGDASCIIPWNTFLFYGDISLLSEQFESMRAWVDYITGVDGQDHGWRRVFHYGDWLALDNPAGGVDQVFGGTEVGFIADTYYMNSARLIAKAAMLLGKADECEKYETLADDILAGIREEYFSSSGRCCIDTQTAHVLTLRYGLWDTPQRAREALKKKFEQTKGKLQTGFVGTPLLCPVLSENGMNGLSYDLLLNEEYPGWLYEVKLGATTVWERWNSVNPDGSISSTGMNSLNHYAYGSIVEWIYRYAAGLQPMENEPGFRKAHIRPMPDPRLGLLTMKFDSAAGTYGVAWQYEKEKLRIRVSIPFGAEGLLELPDAPEALERDSENPMFRDVREGVCHLKCGEYSVCYTPVAERKA